MNDEELIKADQLGKQLVAIKRNLYDLAAATNEDALEVAAAHVNKAYTEIISVTTAAIRKQQEAEE